MQSAMLDDAVAWSLKAPRIAGATSPGSSSARARSSPAPHLQQCGCCGPLVPAGAAGSGGAAGGPHAPLGLVIPIHLFHRNCVWSNLAVAYRRPRGPWAERVLSPQGPPRPAGCRCRRAHLAHGLLRQMQLLQLHAVVRRQVHVAAERDRHAHRQQRQQHDLHPSPANRKPQRSATSKRKRKKRVTYKAKF